MSLPQHSPTDLHQALRRALVSGDKYQNRPVQGWIDQMNGIIAKADDSDFIRWWRTATADSKKDIRSTDLHPGVLAAVVEGQVRLLRRNPDFIRDWVWFGLCSGKFWSDQTMFEYLCYRAGQFSLCQYVEETLGNPTGTGEQQLPSGVSTVETMLDESPEATAAAEPEPFGPAPDSSGAVVPAHPDTVYTAGQDEGPDESPSQADLPDPDGAGQSGPPLDRDGDDSGQSTVPVPPVQQQDEQPSGVASPVQRQRKPKRKSGGGKTR